MIKAEYIKPIPKYIIKRIKNIDMKRDTRDNFYSYLATFKKELVKITVACKKYKNQWFCKQMAVHGIHSDIALVKDLNYSLMGFYVNWYEENISAAKEKHDEKWCEVKDKYFDPYTPIVNKCHALKVDKYKYSVADKYPYSNIFKYLRIYEKYPEVEYLMKLGLYHLSTNQTIIKKLKKDKPFRKWLRLNYNPLKNEYGNYHYFSSLNILDSYKREVSLLKALQQDREVKNMLNNYNYREHVSKIIKKNELLNFLDYLTKQNTEINSYTDYFKACEYLNLDMSLPINILTILRDGTILE